MTVYIGMTLISMFFMFFAQKYYVPQAEGAKVDRPGLVIARWKLYLFLACLPTVLVSGLRYYVGTDYTVYLRVDRYIGSVFAGNPRSMEPLYRVMVQIGLWFNSPQVVFMETSILFSVFAFAFIKKFSKNWTFSVLMLLLTGTFSNSLNLMRQMVAIMIGLYALNFAIERKLWKFVALILFATGIHYLAIMYLPFYFIIGKFNLSSRKGKIRIITFLTILYFVSPYLYGLIRSFLSLIGSNYSRYFGSSREMGASTSVTLLCFFSLIVVFLFLNDKGESTQTEKDFNNLMVLFAIVALTALATRLPNCNRIAYFFLPIFIVLIPNTIEFINNKILKRAVMVSVVFVYSVFWVYFFYITNIGGTFPYQSVFSIQNY